MARNTEDMLAKAVAKKLSRVKGRLGSEDDMDDHEHVRTPGPPGTGGWVQRGKKVPIPGRGDKPTPKPRPQPQVTPWLG